MRIARSLLARPAALAPGASSPEQGAAAEEGAAERRRATHRGRAGHRLFLRLADRAVGVDRFDIEHAHHPLMKPVAVTASVTWSLVLYGCSALGAGYS